MSTTLDKPRTRAQAKAITRQALLEAGLAEIAERGVDGSSLDSICARAGYTRGAFYVHFRNRDDFHIAVMEWVLHNLFDSVIGVEDSEESLYRVVTRFWQGLSGGFRMGSGTVVPNHRLLEAVMHSSQIRRRYAELLQEGAARLARAASGDAQRGRIRPEVDCEALASVLLALALGATQLVELGLGGETARIGTSLSQLLSPPAPARH